MALSADDRLAVHGVIALHGHLVDTGAFDRLGEVFTADVVYDLEALGGGLLEGIDAMVNAARALGDANALGHHVTNVVVVADDDDVATARSRRSACEPTARPARSSTRTRSAARAPVGGSPAGGSSRAGDPCMTADERRDRRRRRRPLGRRAGRHRPAVPGRGGQHDHVAARRPGRNDAAASAEA